jgi:hypothetical protein
MWTFPTVPSHGQACRLLRGWQGNGEHMGIINMKRWNMTKKSKNGKASITQW